MTKHFGNVPANSVLPIFFDTIAEGVGSVTISGFAVTDIEVYKGTSMTQRASDNGYALIDTDGIDLDGITGIHGFSIDTSDNSDASFYSVGSFFSVVVSAITVNGQTVSFIAATFRLVAAESVAGKMKVDVDAFGGSAGTFASGRPEVNTTHAAGTAWGSGAITAASIASSALTSAKFAAGAFDAVWSVTTRLLTAGTNIVLAKGTGVTGFNDLSAAQVNAEVDTGIADAALATAANLATVAGYVDTEVAAIKAKTDLIPASPAATGDIPTANQNADALLDRADAIETGLTLRKALRLLASMLGGKVSGAGTGTEVFRNAVADSKDRVTVTVDSQGNRSAVTTDLT